MTKVKLCGIRRLEDVAILNEVKPDYAGFIFAPSKRQVGVDEAEALRQALDPSIPAVGVFVDADPLFIKEVVDADIIQVVQLHGHEDAIYIEETRRLIGDVPIVQAVRVASPDDVHLETTADMVLFDAYSKGVQGGTGQQFNWDYLAGVDRKYFLAGGLNPDNIRTAIETVRPYAVDISSGVETDGVKDAAKIRALMARIQEVS
ncbi:phosphoribosylanthranilate isomerase [Aerococcus agrisoli]|uniref:N-(5'-phosphoribosyl)anthranilate isomerase n=1 Tax=Aerococcus agrisoli TaxID=2487350 RepID=A0A3N4GD44_9LACT|nr:phosphoribosylanthranilate isomerase [Aerococcus agrisoli]RPA60702.1 phosphoribosylanthranilate isomerase [Aerococcus agrisoli]